MNLINELQKIYNSEINFSISTFWDGGFDVSLGDEINGFEESYNFDRIEDAIKWLIHKVFQYYPNSEYCKESMQMNKKDFEKLIQTKQKKESLR